MSAREHTSVGVSSEKRNKEGSNPIGGSRPNLASSSLLAQGPVFIFPAAAAAACIEGSELLCRSPARPSARPPIRPASEQVSEFIPFFERRFNSGLSAGAAFCSWRRRSIRECERKLSVSVGLRRRLDEITPWEKRRVRRRSRWSLNLEAFRR